MEKTVFDSDSRMPNKHNLDMVLDIPQFTVIQKLDTTPSQDLLSTTAVSGIMSFIWIILIDTNI